MTTPDQGHPESYSSIAVVGLGLMGGSLALALRNVGYKGRLLGVSRRETLDEALEQGVVDQGFEYDSLCEAAAEADLIVLATPIHRIREHIEKLGSSSQDLRSGAVITDVGSTKRVILADAEKHLPVGVHFVGGHPMAGSEKRGFGAADPFLFQNAIYALTPGKNVPQEVVEKLGRVLSEIGARVVVLEAAVHDRLAAAISHLPQLLAIVLVNFLDELADDRSSAVRFAAGGFRDMTRIASSPFDMWRDIYQTNSGEVQAMTEKFIRHVETTANLVGKDALRELFDKAAITRASIPQDTKGFLRPLFEILVVVEDRPGMLAEISTLLADQQINIKDVEVLKVREDQGGTMRLAFSDLEVAKEAMDHLSRAGFKVQLRT